MTKTLRQFGIVSELGDLQTFATKSDAMGAAMHLSRSLSGWRVGIYRLNRRGLIRCQVASIAVFPAGNVSWRPA